MTVDTQLDVDLISLIIDTALMELTSASPLDAASVDLPKLTSWKNCVSCKSHVRSVTVDMYTVLYVLYVEV